MFSLVSRFRRFPSRVDVLSHIEPALSVWRPPWLMLWSFISCFLLYVHLSLGLFRFVPPPHHYFPCIHLGVTVSDVIFSLFSLHPYRRHRFWCDIFIIFLASISASPFLMWSFHYFPCIHLDVTVSDVIFSLFSLHPSRRHRFWCDLFIIFLASISASPFLMWSFSYFPCIHLGVTVSELYLNGFFSV